MRAADTWTLARCSPACLPANVESTITAGILLTAALHAFLVRHRASHA